MRSMVGARYSICTVLFDQKKLILESHIFAQDRYVQLTDSVRNPEYFLQNGFSSSYDYCKNRGDFFGYIWTFNILKRG